jgi:EVE domain
MTTYWLDLFSPTTWQQFLDAGGTVSGFRKHRWSMVSQMKPGDSLLCYLTGVSRFVAVLEVVSQPYEDESKSIWQDEDFPCRVDVRIVDQLSVETAIPIMQLSDRLSIFQNLTSPNAWTGRVRGSPAKWSAADGAIIAEAVHNATINPIITPIPLGKLNRRPKVHPSKLGGVTIPDEDDEVVTGAEESIPHEPPADAPIVEQVKEATAHTEIQWLLLKLGNDMGLDVWAARNDRGRDYNGQRFDSLPRMRSDLPLQFDDVTNKTIELIDVLWLNKNAIVSAFEIESTTSIYSGLLRMSDLLAMQPNINIPLYLVAPDERRNKVLSEVNRPTFSRLSPPLKRVCRYIAFTMIREQLPKDSRLIRHLTSSFLEDYSESCEIEEV